MGADSDTIGELKMSCTKAPIGWSCTRKVGHSGSCAAKEAMTPNPQDDKQKLRAVMNIYLINRSDHGYDEYEGFVVVAESDVEALDFVNIKYNVGYYPTFPDIGTKSVKLIGIASPAYKEITVIISSFNAG